MPWPSGLRYLTCLQNVGSNPAQNGHGSWVHETLNQFASGIYIFFFPVPRGGLFSVKI